jgi:arginyl-tRNA synthetase
MESVTKTSMTNISKYLTNVFSTAIRKAFPLKDFIAQVQWNVTGSSDLACPSAMKIYNMSNKKEGWILPSSKEVAEEIIANVEENSLIGNLVVSQQVTHKKEAPKKEEKVDPNKKPKKEKIEPSNFFIDINLKDSWIEKQSNNILKHGIKLDTEYTNRKILVDFSSPNIAKEMHVGHLRSTILGDTICRILEFLGNDVKRINHVGDWGTQFGMLITNLEEINPNYLEEKTEIKDLEGFYKQAKKRFDEDEIFKKKAHEKTVLLQTGDETCRKAWQAICDVSRNEFNKIYQRLDIKLEEMGESFYDPYCRQIVTQLEEKGLVVVDQGAKVLKLEGFKVPMMLVKTDGGLTYDTTDLAALWYRLIKMERDWCIYVIGSEQELHLKLLFEAGKVIGWHHPPETRLDHMAFGLMLGADGKKISTREGGSVKLTDLLDEAKVRAKKELVIRAKEHNVEYSEDFLEDASSKIGYSAVKYFDLKQFRTSQYKFSYDLMLDPKGNTAVYLFYSYVRICSIYRKTSISDEEVLKLISTEEITISHPKERDLLVHILKFNDVIEEIFDDLAVNKLPDYVYGLATRFSEFYEECKIVGDEKMKSRMLIVELSRRFMKLSFDLLGLTPVEKI